MAKKKITKIFEIEIAVFNRTEPVYRLVEAKSRREAIQKGKGLEKESRGKVTEIRLIREY